MIDIRSGSKKLYKGHYFIVFYDKNDMYLQYVFDNVRDILKFMKKDVTRLNVNLVNVELYRALRREKHLTRFLTGEYLRVYIIDLE